MHHHRVRLQVQLLLRHVPCYTFSCQLPMVAQTGGWGASLSSLQNFSKQGVKMKYRLSTQTHQFQRDEVVAFYNALKIRPVFVGREVANTVNQLGVFEETDFLQALSLVPDAEGLLNAMVEHKIVVKADVSEADILAWHQDMYTGHPSVQVMYLLLTDICNLGCKYCKIMQFAPGHAYQHMSTSVAEKALLTFARLIKGPHFEGEKSVIIYGGEPTANWKVLLFVPSKVREMKEAGALPQALKVSMNTNGTLLTEKYAKKLVDSGIDSVSVSLDGDRSANASRVFTGGAESFNAAMKGLRNCLVAGINTSVSCTLTEATLARFDQALAMILQTGVKGLGFNLVMPTPGNPVADDYTARATAAIIKAFKVFRAKGIYEDRIMRKARAFVEEKIFPFDCAASGGNQIAVAPDGRIGICHGYISSGKTFVADVTDPDFDPINNPLWQDWSHRSPLCMPQCENCPALGICGGGCPMLADETRGNIHELDQRFCVHAKTLLEWMIWDAFEHAKASRDTPPH
jgi:uncharacterized protein